MRKLLLLIAILFATIAKSAITVNSPNGGEIWAGCTVHNITWSGPGTSGFYTVEYSTDGGTSWTSLATNLNATSYSWTVPNTTSSNCLVRVFDFNTPATVDQSNLAFTITAPLILTSPNGGEVWQVGGPVQNITWAASGTGTFLTLEYSINMGVSWTSISTSVTASAGTYAWTIPNFPSTQCLVRIRDNGNSCMTDVSDNLFTISPPTHVITVTAPNTAVTWYVYQSYNITWTSSYVTANVMLEYSIDGGTSWITIIASTSNSGSYNWTPIPNTPSNQCLVRVSEVGLPATNDVSNVNFTIAPPVITVTSPNTAVTWYVGNPNNITWNNTTLSGPNVKLDYSIDGGSSWLPIVASVANTGTYSWTVPNNPSTTCRVRVSDASAPTTFDISNVDFTIASPYILVSSPNGTENFNGCSVQNITWTRAGTTNNVRIEYSINGGSSWSIIVASTSNTGSYSWNYVPNTPSANCLVRITDVSVPATTDVSNAPFNITQNTSIVITSPNGGEIWQVGGAAHAITWAASGTTTNLTLEYSIDNGATWIGITTVAASSGTYNWTIPNNPSTTCLVRLSDQAVPLCKFDVSDAVFTISPPTHVITVTSPNTALTYYVANNYNITWTSAYLTSPFVVIDYSTDNGASWLPVTASTNNTGSYTWTVPNTPSTQCLVRVSEYSNPACFDVSNVNFTIAPPFIQVSTPNGGESYTGCSVQNITWTRGGTTNNVRIEYSLNGGASWSTIVSSTSNTGSYSWNVVPNSPSSNCLIRITDVSVPATTDVSNAPFTILQNTSIIVTAPNGGQVWQVGGPTQIITWAASGTSTNLTLEYSIDNGASWIGITSVLASAGTYNWTIPNNPSTTCLIRLTDQITSCKFDVSDAVFTISPPTHVITVTAPNTALTYYVANVYNITWTSAYLTSPFVVIDYSIDNGATWISITTSTNNTGSYSWTVPNTPSNQCLVKVSEYGNPACTDVSNVNFTIAPAFILVSSPNGGENLTGCSTPTITWTRGGTINNVRIEYSINGGASWSTIVASTSNTGSYSWNYVPNTPSTNCLIRITDVLVPATTDVSNLPFNILQNTAIIVTSPNGGEVWQVGGPTHNITWAASGTSTNLTLEYSINNGASWISIATVAASAGTYTWTIPNNPSTTCLVRLLDQTFPACKFDVSDAVFTISPPTHVITVTAPNTAVNWYVYQSYNITWTSSYVTANVMLEYSIDGGTSWITILASTPNSGSYNWTIPNTPSNQCRVRVSEVGLPATNDISDVNFTIAPPVITVTSPNTAVTWYVGNTNAITWTNTTLSGPNVKIDYSTDAGASWLPVVASVANTGTYNWVVPNTPSTTCLVRVSDFTTPTTFDISNTNFIIASPWIIVGSPNGSEVLNGCSVPTITWTRAGTTNNVRIEYSLNGGSSWVTIVSSTSNTGSYAWNVVPNSPSTNCLIRITDVVVPATTDMSNAPFTISQNTAIVVNTPNGGEVWQVGGPAQAITWAASGTSATLTLEYSIDNGVNWIGITSVSASAGSYNWTIPNNPSTNCLVRLTDPSNTCKFDMSNAVFTIAPPTPVITVTAPNTAVTWYIGTGYTISWTSAYLTSPFVAISYSTDAGLTWNVITASTNNTGSYAWTAVAPPSTQCLVRVSEYGNPAVFDVSNVNFTIANPIITVTAPNGSETYNGCSVQTITWTRAGTTNNVRIEYSTNGGSSWSTIVGSTSNTGSYSWNVVPNTSSNNCLIRITDVVTSATTDISNAPFTITPNNSIIITSPNGGEVWQVGGPTQNITWAASGTSGSLTLEYSTNNGGSWTYINTVVATAGSYTWTIPNAPSTTCLVRLYDAANSCKMDQSDAVFTISPPTPYIVVTAPNTAVTWYVGSAYNITWNSGYLASTFVKIDYSIDNGTTWIPITAATNNTGSYSWTAVNPPSTTCLVKVSDYGNLSTFDVSNVTFTINPPMVVTAPNGTEVLNSCTSSSITWFAGGCSGSYRIEYSTNGGSSWNLIVGSYGAATTGAGSYTWSIPNTPSTNCLVRVSDAAAPTKIDQSNATFTIAPAITVTQPNFGGTYVVSTVQNITWTSTGVSNFYNIDYSIDNGATWINIVFNANIVTNTYAWTVPSNPSTNCLVRVIDNVNTCKRDQSDNVFTISSTIPAITVTAPNGGENWPTCSTQSITWTASGTSGQYNLDYSTNGGSSWTSIITNYAAAGSPCSYSWTIPNTISSTCLVKVTDAIVTTRTDQSNLAFTISSSVPLVASGTATICNGASTSLSAAGATTYAWLPTTGLSNPAIANPVASPTTTTTYTVTGTTGACSTTATITVTVNPIPNITATPAAPSICAGSSVTLVANGATSYSWLPATGLSSTTVYNPVANPGTTTTYTVTGTSAGCSNTATSVVTVNPIPTVTISGTSPICAGTSSNLSASGATTYSWLPATGLSSPTIANPIATPAGTTTYTVTGTALGCSGTAPFTVNVLPSPTVTVSGGGNICVGGSTTITASGTSVSYSWSPATGLSNPNIANPVASPASTTTYTVTGTSGSCSNTATVTVSVIPTPVVSISGGTNICNGTSTALTASGATTYSWSPAVGLSSAIIANPNAYPSTTTTYTVTGTTSSCTGTGTVMITVNPAPSISITGGGTICAGSSTSLNATGAISYTWLPATGLSSTTIANPVATPATTTTYTVTGTGAGCSSTATVVVTVVPIPVITVSGTGTICDGSTTNLTATGAATYSWSPSTGLSSATVANPIASPNATITYTVTGTTSGCVGTTTKTITVNPVPVTLVSPDVTICNGTTTTLTASGAATYSWSPATALSSSTVANPVCSTTTTRTYTVTGTSLGCSSTAVVVVTVTPLPTVSASGAATICNGASTTITASGTSTSYSWLPSASLSNATIANPVASPSTTTTYTVTGTANGCSNTATVVVTVNPIPAISISGPTTICTATSTVLTASGATSYVWSPGTGLSSTTVASPTASPASTITYTINGTALGCTGSTTFTLNVVPALAISATGSATICSGTSTPLNASGAVSYVWTPAAGLSSTTISNPTASPTANTTYVVTGTSGTCTDTAHVIVNVITSPSVSISGTTTICNGNSTTLTATGATTYSWSPSTGLSNAAIANPVANPTTTTTYTVTGTTGVCSSTTTVTITVNPIPPVTASGTATICSGLSTPLTSSGATTYAWLPATGLSNASIANPTATPASTTTYTVTGTSLGCSATATVAITVNPTPTASAGSPATICLGGSGTTLNASGGTTYAWLPATGLSATNISNPIANPSSTTTYTVTVGTGSCSATASVVVTVNTLPSVNAGSDASISCSGSTTLSASGGTTYSWSPATGLSNPNIANPVANPGVTTSYTVTGTTGGCSGTDVVVVTVSPLTANAGSDVTLCASEATVLTGSAVGVSSSYAWANAQRFGSTSVDRGYSSAADAAGNHYITGEFSGTVTFGAFSLTAVGGDIYIVKINPTGTVLWAQKAGGSGIDGGQGITVDASGNVYVTGDIGNGVSTFGALSVTGGGGLDMFVAKYNSAGTCQWVQRAGNSGTDEGYAVATDGTNVWVTGTFVGNSVAFGSISISAHSATDEDGFVAKYSAATGTCLWAAPAGSSNNVERGVGVSCDAAGNAYICAILRGPTVNFGSISLTCDVNYDPIIAKYNSAGICQWAKRGGVMGLSDYARAIVTDGAGNSYLVGNAGTGTATFGAISLATAQDAIIVKYNSAGVEQWVKAIGGSSIEHFLGVAIDPLSGNIYAVGSATSASVTIGPSVLTGFGASGNVMLGVFSNSGTELFGIKSNSVSPGGDYAYAISADGSGNAYITGQFASTGGTTATFGSTTITTAGAGDIFVAKLVVTNPLTYAWSPATGLSSTTVACPTATPTSTTNYVFTVTSGACVSSDNVVVTIAPTPVANAGSDVTICTGTSTPLTATGGTIYSWLPATGLSATNIANPTANPTTTTTYTVTVSNGGSCNSTATVTVSVSPFGPVSAGSNATIGCGSTTTLAGSGGTTYVWSPSTGLSNPNIANPVASPSATTTYTVTASTGSCTGTSSVTITVSDVTADAGPYAQICAGSSTVLAGSATGGPSTRNFIWAKGSTGTAGAVSNAVTSDASGNSYSTGYFSGTSTFGAFNLTSSGGSDIFFAKYNSAGVCQWAVKAGGTSTAERGNGIAVDGSGNVYATGYFQGTATFGSFSVTATGGASDVDLYIAKFNSAGVCQWVQKAASTTSDNGYAIATDASGNSYITGSYSGAATFGAFSLTNSGSEDLFIAKYNTSGICQWARKAGSTNADRGVGITIDASGNPVATGFFTGTVTFGSTTVSAVGGAADNDLFVTKLDPSGNFIWTISAGSTGSNSAKGVSADASGNLYITGTVTSTMTLGSTTLTSTGTNDIYIAKLNSSGVFQWAKMGGGGATDQSEGIATDAAGTSYVTGSITGSSATFGTVTIGGGSGLDALMVAYDNAGTPLYGFRCGGSGSDMGYGVSVDPLGNIYVGGSFSGTATFGPNSLTSSSSDAFITQIGAATSASYVWTPPTGLSATNVAMPTATPASTTTYTLTVTSGSCSSTDTVTVSVLPAPTANAGSPVTICSGTSTPLNATGGSIYSWLPATGLSATNIANPVASPTTTTTYTVTVSNGGTCTATATVTVTVTPSPTANAGSDVTISCGASTTLSASGGTTYSWLPTTGLSNPNISNPVCTPPYTTTYTVTVSNGSCSSTDVVTITTGTLTTNAGPDVSICTGGSTPLNGTSAGGGAPAWVNLSTSYNYSQSVATYTAITGGTVWLNGASPDMDDLVSGVVAIPTFRFNNVNYTSLRISTNGFITFGATAPATTTYLAISSTETYGGAIAALSADLNKATSGTPEIRYQTVGSEFVIQWRDMGRYNASGTLDRVSFQIRLNTSTNQVNIVYGTTSLLGSSTTYPQVGLRGANNTFAGNVNNRTVISSTGAWVNSTAGTTNASNCYYNSATPATIPASGTTFTWSLPSATTSYSWSPPTGLSATNIANPVASPTATTTYTLTTTNGFCTAVDQVTVTVTSAGSVSAGADATICGGGNTTLAATGGGTYSWAPATGLSATNIANPVASPASTTTYTVTVSNGSCSFTDAVVVTVNPLPAQPGTITGNTSICASSTNTYSIPAVAGATSYTWTLPGGWSGTSTTTSINATANASGGTISVVANNACGAGTAQTLNVTMSGTPAQPASISGSVTVCFGSSNIYTAATVAGATSYNWTLPGGWSGTSTTNTITGVASASGNITVTASNPCGTSTAQTFAVVVDNTPAQPGSIIGSTTVCSGTAQTYTVGVVAGATSYTWTMPGGWTGTSATNNINATAGTSSGNITVTANNGCGASTPQTVAVTVNSAPAQPVAITGSNSVCPGSGNTYSVTADPGATSYTWTLPGGWSGTSTTNSINTTATSTGGMISVIATNGCGSSTAQTLTININTAPVQPSSINGGTVVCSGSTNTFDVTADPGATSYAWTLPGGWSGTSTTNSINATANATAGTITVIASNACGSSPAQTLGVSISTVPAQPAAISGTTAMCEGTSQLYSVTNDASATGYTWSMPGDWTGTSTTNSITATIGASSGMISVTADNSCGSSTAQTIAVTVNPLPATPVLSGNDTVCAGSTQGYSVTPIGGATSYTWTIPGTWTGSSTSDNISVVAGTTSGNILVHATNGCGDGPDQTLSIIVQTAPAALTIVSSDSVVCEQDDAVVELPFDANITTYNWTIPATWTGFSTWEEMTATVDGTSGVITVTATNTCGTSPMLSVNITVNPLPTVTVSNFGIVCDNDSPFTLTGGSPAGGFYSGTGVSGTDLFSPAVSGAGVFTIFYIYSDVNGCSAAASDSIQVDLCTGVAAATPTGDVIVYPNPFSDYTTISIGKTIQLVGTEVHIFDMLGKEVMILSNIHTYDVRIDRENLRDGMYFYRLINDGKEINTGKLIIE